ncbi:MAG: cytochrome c biogenesis protein CcdA [Bradyrhizobium sp.]|jgi:cytochrome c biogenesis protein CcdA|uniref:Sulfite exporter TauE/SafE family protein n=1 Tax=Bradyrhizobium denitrificans TaxID=2734912 RepID=A0ABS5GCL7_9BRAD|nr:MULTISPECIES: cytochrome c biogenesis protein CcdA [Bradyrhizobium]MBR1139080.1 sulfite exporter TauE/SafE family protein [Bradyrhizobium denitrificans]MDU0960355.1 cytochrome c biogenesis protein CcdA [Bradyrhizobium sp.]MDU1496089.1 cytochrome c biogenesis protein CcdA [Bradyrhizobium sp.]MDU1546240.1 cytochrome c biogenesis protein CcdA [Bradyrhizobium sp.]MDU1665473.1 cytochrome c biogenesis protein CcdA [Bradyrhizobium sp.]
MLAILGFAFLAGVFSSLSPCVLPLLPLVLGAAVSEHRLGPAALSAGLALSFALVGLFVATIGFGLGLDSGVFRNVAAVIMLAIGLVMIVPRLQAGFAVAAGPVGNWAEQRFGGFSRSGISGQFAVGLLLGVVWAPCVGPTLGAASLMAARGENLSQVALTMILFGIGASLPLLALGMLSRETMIRLRGRLHAAGHGAKIGMGVVLLAIGVLILSGSDKRLEAALVAASPAWLTELSTRF